MFEIRKIKHDYSDWKNETDVPMNIIASMIDEMEREVYCDGILMARTGCDIIREYPEYMGITFEQACYDYLMKYSGDGTLQSGIDRLIEETDEHYESHVGWIVGGRMVYSGKYAGRDYDLWNEEEEEAESRRQSKEYKNK